METNIKYILKGKFLVKEHASRSWNFIVFVTVLSLISIASSHMMDRKIRRITNLGEEIKELKSEYVDIHTYSLSTLSHEITIEVHYQVVNFHFLNIILTKQDL
jgi:hypothetical protein